MLDQGTLDAENGWRSCRNCNRRECRNDKRRGRRDYFSKRWSSKPQRSYLVAGRMALSQDRMGRRWLTSEAEACCPAFSPVIHRCKSLSPSLRATRTTPVLAIRPLQVKQLPFRGLDARFGRVASTTVGSGTESGPRNFPLAGSLEASFLQSTPPCGGPSAGQNVHQEETQACEVVI
jgi:hypothetical protein